jgi:hypothetical protein
MELPDGMASKKKVSRMMGNSDGITGFIGNRGRKTKFVSNYMKVLELFGNRDELTRYLSF